eukprot:5722597-Amphidinium_carterae.2
MEDSHPALTLCHSSTKSLNAQSLISVVNSKLDRDADSSQNLTTAMGVRMRACYTSIEEPRLTAILRQLQTIRQLITDANVISGYNPEAESGRCTSLSKVMLHRLSSMTEGESHALVQSLIHTAYGYEALRKLNIQHYGGSVARQDTHLKLILPPTWGNHSSAGEMLKHYTQQLQTIQE